MSRKKKNPFSIIAEGISNAVTLVAAIPVFLIGSVFDG